MNGVAIDQHFSGTAPSVVVARHAHAISACRQHGQRVARLNIQFTIAANPITAFAHGAHHIDQGGGAGTGCDRHDLVKGLVHGRARQVVHGRIDDAKVFLLAGFHEDHVGQAHAGIAHQRAARLDHQLTIAKAAGVELGQQRMPERIGRWRCVAVVVDAQATTKVDVMNGNACRFHFGHQIQDAVHGV